MHSPASSRSTNLRMVALSAICLFIGLQFKNLRDLFGTIGDVDIENGAWAPDDFGDQPTRTKRGQNRDRAKARRQRREKNKDSTNEGKAKKKKKNVKKSRRFEMTNYTEGTFEPLPWTLPESSPMRHQTSEEFMAKYIATKRKHNIPLPWEEDKDKYADKAVSLPLPIISLNFPKSATLTIKHYFDCGGITSIHTSTQDGRIGVCMMENQFDGKPPLDRCNTHSIRDKDNMDKPLEIVPIDFISDIGMQGPPCYYSSLHDGGLENIAEHYPTGTILLVTRNATSWYRSMSKWGTIMHRWKKFCGFDGHLHQGDNMDYWTNMFESQDKEEYWVNFYHAHTQKIREFAMKHLSMTYVEVELENKKIGQILEKYTKVPPSCIMDCHPGPNWVRQNNVTSRCHPVGQNPAHMKAQTMIEEEDGDNDDDDNTESGDNGDDDGEKDVNNEEREE
eukprot:CAMPEP_0172314574 /NCGR_PEP_ID=MMETSP1058-20130122/22862_1 /TAXON_ID=83371 /ORGANISM="Detonula confervacea, Strain CCMP 353" /LENGTH=447 /DNA_ID=CAMNT_0013028471 /DNA_START=208 /DNA_END=1551 /DNA_ORIENTATION=+